LWMAVICEIKTIWRVIIAPKWHVRGLLWGVSIVSFIFKWWANQIGSLWKSIWTWEAAHLISQVRWIGNAIRWWGTWGCYHNTYCKQCKSTVFLLFPWLPIFPSKICLEMPIHILCCPFSHPRSVWRCPHTYCAAHYRLWVLLCTFWACNRH
jgi:hypothetical protein